MSAFISKKLTFLLLICGWCVSSAIVFLFNFAAAGPKLGPVYDLLLNFRSAPPVSGEILLITSDEIIEADGLFSVLMTLSEAGASDLLVEVPVLGTGAGRTESGTELSRRVTDEFSLLGRNIRNLFNGIRLGSVSPAESAAYVDSLVELSERGRDRLNAVIIREGEAGSIRAAQAAAVFGKSFSAVDLRSQNREEIPWFSKSVPDKDGILRRMAPVISRDNDIPMEHIAYHALKTRWEKSTFEETKSGKALVNQFKPGAGKITHRFPLDREGNILLARPGKNGDFNRGGFRRVALDDFLQYDQADRDMARLLQNARETGVYAVLEPEQIPLFLYDYCDSLKEDLLADPDDDKLAVWKTARAEYINSLDKFLYGPSEMTLVNGYEELIAGETHDGDGIAKLQTLRDELIRTFIVMREKHLELVSIRAVLAEAASSFCIMGPAQGGGIPESSALLANALLTGHCIKPGRSLYIVIWSLIVSFAVIAGIHFLEPAPLLFAGLGSSLLCGAGFAVAFIFSGYWIDPLIPSVACLGGTLVMTVLKTGIGYGRALRFRLALNPSVNKAVLKSLVKAEGAYRPLLTETVCAHAAIIAVKNPALYANRDTETPLEAAGAAAEFRKTFSRIFKQAGALVLPCEGDIALACFGSPHERVYLEQTESENRYSEWPDDPGGTHPAARAARYAGELLKSPRYAGWHFGIESGECAFSRPEGTGFTANGRPVIYAKMYADLASRNNVRVILGEAAKAGTKKTGKA